MDSNSVLGIEDGELFLKVAQAKPSGSWVKGIHAAYLTSSVYNLTLILSPAVGDIFGEAVLYSWVVGFHEIIFDEL